MSRTIFVVIGTTESAEVSRSPSGTPRIESDPQHARLYLATASDDGWLLETWTEAKPARAEQQVRVSNADALIADIADAVRAIAERG